MKEKEAREVIDKYDDERALVRLIHANPKLINVRDLLARSEGYLEAIERAEGLVEAVRKYLNNSVVPTMFDKSGRKISDPNREVIELCEMLVKYEEEK